MGHVWQQVGDGDSHVGKLEQVGIGDVVLMVDVFDFVIVKTDVQVDSPGGVLIIGPDPVQLLLNGDEDLMLEGQGVEVGFDENGRVEKVGLVDEADGDCLVDGGGGDEGALLGEELDGEGEVYLFVDV